MHETTLTFFCDNANGQWGVSHINTIKEDEGNAFNAFWSPLGIFHDVFEHYFEGVHRRFRGDAFRNVSGEVVAMGHMTYYIYGLRSSARYGDGPYYRGLDQTIIDGTHSYIQEAIEDGHVNYGRCFYSNIPQQKRTRNYHLECLIDEHGYQVRKLRYKKDRWHSGDEQEWSREYKRSLTYTKLASCYRYGWKMAERLVPTNEFNWQAVEDFYTYWGRVCKEDAEELSRLIYRLHFKVWKDRQHRIRWRCEVQPMEDTYGWPVIDSLKLKEAPTLMEMMENYVKP
jgi:hypothetical protein